MKKLCLTVVVLLSAFSFAQRHEIGLSLGGANLIADIGRTNYIRPLEAYREGDKTRINYHLGLLYRFNFNSQMGLRAQLSYAKFSDSDRRAAENYRINRGYSYEQSIAEAAILFEYNFFDINNIQKFGHSPYIFAGLGIYGYNQKQYTINHALLLDTDGNPIPLDPSDPEGFETYVTSSDKMQFKYNTPFGVGYKFKYKYNWVLAFEVGFRPTNTDRLDHSFAKEDQFRRGLIDPGLATTPFQEVVDEREAQVIADRQVGNISNSDWYVFSGLSLTYTFGRPPCYCD